MCRYPHELYVAVCIIVGTPVGFTGPDEGKLGRILLVAADIFSSKENITGVMRIIKYN